MDRVQEKEWNQSDASVFGLSHREGWSCVPGLGRASHKVKLVEENQDFNFQHTEIEISQRPPNGDEEMPHSSWRSKSGVWGDVWARNRKEGVVSISSHGFSGRFPMEHI